MSNEKNNDAKSNDEFDDFDDFVNQLQKEIEEKEEIDYSEIVRQEYHNPSNVGMIMEPECNGFALHTAEECGDTILIYLKINESNIIDDIKFRTDGCGVTTAVGSKMTKMVKGQSTDFAQKLTPEKLTESLNGLPKEHLHCPKLALTALKKAIDNYEEK